MGVFFLVFLGLLILFIWNIRSASRNKGHWEAPVRRYTCYIDQAIDMYLADRIAQALKHRTAIGGLLGVVCLVVWVVVVTSLLRI